MASNRAPASREPEPGSPERAPDALYAAPRAAGRFRFDAEVARVFPDMLERSVPGYASLVHGITLYGQQHAREGGVCYDLGCSLGTVARALSARLGASHPIYAVDSSADMIARCQRHPAPSVQYQCADIRDVELRGADVVVLNLTLQFLPVADRLVLLRRIAEALIPGGVLILTEKIRFAEEEQRMQQRYEAFKRDRGYSDLEISQKRAALEQVLVRDSLPDHHERLQQAGFDSITLWYQCLHFTSMLACRNAAQAA